MIASKRPVRTMERTARRSGRSLRASRGSARRGFSFIELVVVASTIALLATIAVPNFLEAQLRGAVARSRADLAAIHLGLEAYRLDHRAYPPNRETGKAGQDDLLALTTPVPYLSSVPLDYLTTAQSRRNHSPGFPAIRYRYLNGRQMNPETGFRFGPNEPAAFEGRVLGLVWGIGPAEAYPAKGSDSRISVSPDAVVDLTIYDPTNGSISTGQIAVSVP